MISRSLNGKIVMAFLLPQHIKVVICTKFRDHLTINDDLFVGCPPPPKREGPETKPCLLE